MIQEDKMSMYLSSHFSVGMYVKPEYYSECLKVVEIEYNSSLKVEDYQGNKYSFYCVRRVAGGRYKITPDDESKIIWEGVDFTPLTEDSITNDGEKFKNKE